MEESDMHLAFDTDEEADAEFARLEAFLASDDGLGKLFPVPAVPSTSCSVATSHQSQSLPSTDCDEDALELKKIESALSLNKIIVEKIKALENVLVGRLHECRKRLADIHNSSKEKPERKEIFRYVNCGKPYFKDKSNFPAPPNEDTIIMAKSKMYDFSQITSVPGWTVNDKSSFSKLILKMSIKIRKDKLTSKIAQIKREGKNKNSEQLAKEVDAVNKEIMALNNKTLKEVALPIDEEYDWDLVANTLNKRHSAIEYRSLWKVFLHPDINKNVWSKSEHTLLHETAKKYDFQDWESIAKELNTGRSGYQCFVYYRTNISNTCTGKKWTKEEEEYLRRLIEYYKEDDYIPWGKVASAMENRTKIQIYNKYFRLVEKRKGRFVPEEDGVILACIEKFGLNFKKMAEYLPGRSATQIRVRYGVLAKKRTSAVWSIDEDKRLLETMANEDIYTNYSTVSKYFRGKTRTQARTRYLTLIKWMKGHPNSSIESAPRRAARSLSQGLPTENLNKAIEKLKKRIELEIEYRKTKRITRKSPFEVINKAFLTHFVAEYIEGEELRRAEKESEKDVVVLNDEIVSAMPLNIPNFQKLIIFFKGNLNQDLVRKSAFAEQYPEILKSKPKVKRPQMKSYSKKSGMTALNEDGTLDIWGNNSWGPLTYVLPPNYATITGCRRIMAYISSMQTKVGGAAPLNINLLMRGNPALKSSLFLLMERFNTLLMFPMLLFNVDPKQIGKMLSKGSMTKSAEYLKINEWDITKSDDSKTSNSLGFLIPQIPKVQALTGYNTTTIDLEEPNPEQKKEICLQKVVTSENNIQFVAEGKVRKYKRRKK